MTTVAAAFVALALASATGAVLAGQVMAVRDQLERGRIVEVFAPAGAGKVVQIAGDAQSMELLLRFVNSMAGVVSNMEVSPKWRFSQFADILDASKRTQTQIRDFACNAQTMMLTIDCIAQSDEAAGLFAEELEQIGFFKQVELSNPHSKTGEQFTIHGWFSE